MLFALELGSAPLQSPESFQRGTELHSSCGNLQFLVGRAYQLAEKHPVFRGSELQLRHYACTVNWGFSP
jgi:hypothetical protein